LGNFIKSINAVMLSIHRCLLTGEGCCSNKVQLLYSQFTVGLDARS